MSVEVEQIPIEQAAANLGVPAEILAHLVRAKVLVGYTPASTGTEGQCDLDQAADLAAQLRAARAPVEGNGVLAPDAAEKYGFGVVSIYNWHNSGWVRLVEDKARGRLYNEGDIAVARALANLMGQVAGRSVFPAKPRSGRPRKLDN